MNPPPFDLATVEAPFFEPFIGHRFLARPADVPDAPPLELELNHVQPFHHLPQSGGRAPFSIFFKTPDPARMIQGTYECTGPGLEEAPAAIFLVPVRDPLRGLCLEAVFN